MSAETPARGETPVTGEAPASPDQTHRSGVETVAARSIVVEGRGGSGTPVLFANGCGLPRQVWGPVVDRLARPVVTFDRPGIGTPWPRRLPTLAEEVETLAELAAGLDQPVLVAHSMAALHAEGLLLEQPGLVSGLVLVDPSVEWRALRPWPGVLQQGPGLVSGLNRARGFGQLVSRAVVLGTRTQTVTGLSDDLRASMGLTYASDQAQAMALAESIAYRDQVNALVDLRRRTALATVPTTVLCATNSHSTQAMTRLCQHFRAHQVLIGNSRHLIMVDAPQAVLAAIASPGGTR